MAIPKAFVSYSHDSQDHKKWVLDFATRLRNNGVDASLDQWDLKPGDDLPYFMERGLAAADRVLMVCTDKYVAKANSGAGGVQSTQVSEFPGIPVIYFQYLNKNT